MSGSSVEVYRADRICTVRTLTDGSGGVIGTYRTDEWGNVTESSGTSTQPFGFTGEPRDGTGLTYLRARFYDPDLGRFVSQDTWRGSPAIPQTLDRYSYVANNPTARADPSGHCGVDTVFDVAFVGYDILQILFGPERERDENWTSLALDAGSTLIPCVAGLGFLTHGLRTTRAEFHVTETVLSHVDDRPLHQLSEPTGHDHGLLARPS